MDTYTFKNRITLEPIDREWTSQRGYRLRGELTDPHKSVDSPFVVTSKILMIDFDRGIAITQNNIYLFPI